MATRAKKSPAKRAVAATGSGSKSTAKTVATKGKAGGESAATPGSSGGRTGSTIDMVYGWRPMKGYPITEGELGHLFGIGLFATICFSLAAGLFGFALDVTKDLAFAPETPQAVVGFWEAAKTFSWVFGVLFFVIGVGFFFRRGSVLNKIKASTTFPDHDGTR